MPAGSEADLHGVVSNEDFVRGLVVDLMASDSVLNASGPYIWVSVWGRVSCF